MATEMPSVKAGFRFVTLSVCPCFGVLHIIQVFEILLNLFIHSLLPTRMLQMEDFLGGVSMIPLRGSSSQLTLPPPRGDALLSTLSSYFITPYSPSQHNLIPHPPHA